MEERDLNIWENWDSIHGFEALKRMASSFPRVDNETINAWARKMRSAETREEHEGFRNRIVDHNLRLVLSLAAPFEKHPEKLQDAISAGFLGLITAAEKYNPEMGYQFSTLATWWIRQAISREKQLNYGDITIPVHAVEKLSLIHRFQVQFYGMEGRMPSIKEMADGLSLKEEFVSWLLSVGHVDSLNRPVQDSDREDSELQDFIPDPGATVEQEVFSRLDNKTLESWMERLLSPRELQVLKMRYGLDPYPQMTLEEVGQTLGVTRERVRQIEAKAKRKLRIKNSFRRAMGREELSKEELKIV